MKNLDKLKKEKKTNDLSNIAFAMIAGALAGAALGMLFAPVKGKELRKNIKCFAKYLTVDMLNYSADAEIAPSSLETEKGQWEQFQRAND